MNFQTITQTLVVWLAAFGLKILGAIALWVIGRWLIHFAIRLIVKGLKKRPIEPTVINYLASTVSVLLNITLVVAILGYFGVQTTTFAALIASAGFAIGLAWSGLLSNFAAGAFLMILRPFKVGDFVTAGGVAFVGNGKIFADNIQNFSVNPYRRVELEAQLDHTVNVADAVQRLKQRVQAIPNVTATPAVDVEVLKFSPFGPVLAVRPYTNNQHYWQVFFDTNRVIRETFVEAGLPTPEQHLAVSNTAFLERQDGHSVAAAH
jgi:small conductance mechanosensitive channel